MNEDELAQALRKRRVVTIVRVAAVGLLGAGLFTLATWLLGMWK